MRCDLWMDKSEGNTYRSFTLLENVEKSRSLKLVGENVFLPPVHHRLHV